jgi:hypothetical protein
VEIQEESINELAKVEDVAFQYLEKISAYYANRTRVAAKISKYPASVDRRQQASGVERRGEERRTESHAWAWHQVDHPVTDE